MLLPCQRSLKSHVIFIVVFAVQCRQVILSYSLKASQVCQHTQFEWPHKVTGNNLLDRKETHRYSARGGDLYANAIILQLLKFNGTGRLRSRIKEDATDSTDLSYYPRGHLSLKLSFKIKGSRRHEVCGHLHISESAWFQSKGSGGRGGGGEDALKSVLTTARSTTHCS